MQSYNFGRNTVGVKRGGHNKGIRLPRTKERAELFKAGTPIFCKRHGKHLEWEEYKTKSQAHPVIRCKKCAIENTKDYIRRNYLRTLARWTHRRDSNSEVTEEFLRNLMEKQNGHCALTGVKFDDENKPSVDRINSSVGYIKSNIQLILFDINRMKSSFPLDYFIKRCTQVAEKANGKISSSV